jgi:serine/threonine-protein kinase
VYDAPVLRARSRLGKYRLEKKIGEGGYAVVYRAYDTIEGIPVALKIPSAELLDKEDMKDVRREVRISATLDHPNVLTIKNASIIDKRFVIVYPLGGKTLGDRLRSKMSTRMAIDFAEQMLEALAYAHKKRIIHCDIKPENFILFAEGKLRLTDFGISKVAQTRWTLVGSGTGTLGYVAPEQAFGKPSLRSDVFSMGLLLYRMFSGHLPEWPYEWPPQGYDRIRQTLPHGFITFLRRSMEIDERKRFADAGQMLQAFRRLKPKALRRVTTRARRRSPRSNGTDWKTLRTRQFKRKYGTRLETRHACERCGGPVSEAMHHCPWCGRGLGVFAGVSKFPERCKRCGRGQKLDWKYCAWCYGPSSVKNGVEPRRRYSDRRYEGRCQSATCTRKELMPYMRYCPWCRTKVRRPWKIAESKDRCRSCGWGVVSEFWDHCPWCGVGLGSRSG